MKYFSKDKLVVQRKYPLSQTTGDIVSGSNAHKRFHA